MQWMILVFDGGNNLVYVVGHGSVSVSEFDPAALTKSSSEVTQVTQAAQYGIRVSRKPAAAHEENATKAKLAEQRKNTRRHLLNESGERKSERQLWLERADARKRKKQQRRRTMLRRSALVAV